VYLQKSKSVYAKSKDYTLQRVEKFKYLGVYPRLTSEGRYKKEFDARIKQTVLLKLCRSMANEWDYQPLQTANLWNCLITPMGYFFSARRHNESFPFEYPISW